MGAELFASCTPCGRYTRQHVEAGVACCEACGGKSHRGPDPHAHLHARPPAPSDCPRCRQVTAFVAGGELLCNACGWQGRAEASPVELSSEALFREMARKPAAKKGGGGGSKSRKKPRTGGRMATEVWEEKAQLIFAQRRNRHSVKMSETLRAQVVAMAAKTGLSIAEILALAVRAEVDQFVEAG